MLTANDKYNNIIYADVPYRHKDCICPWCGEAVTHKKGKIYAPHFSHKSKSECPYGKDNKSPWHIRMQKLFPNEALEVRFKDSVTGELKHIADVFVKESNTVIEFQHSPISEEEFTSRTRFHISEGRRVVWVFNESEGKYEFGRLRGAKYEISDWMHKDYDLDWPRSPRQMLNALNIEKRMDLFSNLSICIYFGDGENTVHRIISHDYDYYSVTISVHSIILSAEMDIDDFFKPEDHWLQDSPWKEKIDAHNERINRMKAERATEEAENSILHNTSRGRFRL